MTPLSRKRILRKSRGRSWTSDSSKKANRARWDADRRRREKEEPDRAKELAEIEAINLPRRKGDVIGILQWTEARTGKVRRWIVRIGDRSDRMTLEMPGGQKTKSHGWTWIMTHLRSRLFKSS